MNRNFTAIILIVLSIAIYFTFTSGKITEIKSVQAVNTEYQKAITNAEQLIRVRDSVLKKYNEISPEDRDRLAKILPDTVDNIRLIIDVKDDIAAKHGLVLKNIKTGTLENNASTVSSQTNNGYEYGSVILSFSVTTDYNNFLNFLKDLESSLRIMEISKLTVSMNPASDSSLYDFSIDIKTFWLKQK